MYCRWGKRLFDAAAALLGLILFMPVFAVIAVAVILDSPGPLLFRQKRMGREGRLFALLKFRTMRASDPDERKQFEPGSTMRITHTGQFLRRTKLDELPQLINVLLGDMSLVGPRPEVEKYREYFSGENSVILTMRPGITDPASIKYRHEESILAASASPEQLYRDVILPDKLRIYEAYVTGKPRFFSDISIIVKTLSGSSGSIEENKGEHHAGF